MPQKLIGNFINIVTKKYFCFNGRAGRAEFWLFFLALGVTARRLHDRNKSGWMILVSLIPLIGTLILLIMCIPEGDKGENKFGPTIN